jgi:HEPN domain-containing protein
MKKFVKFDIEKTVSYWVSSAKYDLSVANALFKTKKYPYTLFMGHLALEKLLKALIVKQTKKHAPFSHSLPYLAENSNLKVPEKILIKLSEFMEFHIEGRYPDVNKAFYKKASRAYTAMQMKEIKEVFKWIKDKL